MKVLTARRLGVLVVATCLLSAPIVRADSPDEPPRSETAADSGAGAAEEVLAEDEAGLDDESVSPDPSETIPHETGLPAEFEDAAFQVYVDLRDAAAAIANRDASLLADVALQLGEAEKVLVRQHKSGVTAKRLLEKAAKLAADTQDAGTLARLAKAADRLEDEELAAQLSGLEKLGGASRAVHPAFTIALETANLDMVLRLKTYLDDIQQAELAGDGRLLSELESQIAADGGMAEPQKTALAERIASAREGLPAEETVADDPVAKLMATSRQHWLTRPHDWGKTGVQIFPRREESVSEIAVYTPPSVDQEGKVWSGTSRGGGRGDFVKYADLRHNAQGLAYWVPNYANLSPVRAPQHDRPQQAEPNFRITDAGKVYESSTYLGEAKRVRFKSGNTGWSFQIPNGWYIYRYDGESRTRKRA